MRRAGESKPVTELDPSVYAELDAELDAIEAGEVLDWDAFWSAQSEKVKPARIRGVVVKPPVDMPLSVVRKLDSVMGSTDEAEHKELLAVIFGADVFDTWETNGMGLREMQVVLAWAGAHMRGESVTFEEALALYAKAAAELERAGKAKPARPKAPGRARSSRKK
jgi:hypothetical protein